MRILTYRDIPSKNMLLPLMDHSFRWLFNPRRFERYVKIDPRLKGSPVGFAAEENGRIVGFVGVMYLPTRTIDGSTEYIGGIYGVATLPNYVRRGICKTLMQHAHEHFEEKGFRFSALTTSRTIVAHSLYEKLGYGDVLDTPSAHKIVEAKKPASTKKKKLLKTDFGKILEIYRKYVENKTGLVMRNEAYLRMLKKTHGISNKQSIVTGRGYVIFRQDKYGTWIRELAALETREMDKLVRILETRSKNIVYDRLVLDNKLLEVYKRRRYMIQKRSHSVIMVKPLTVDASFEQTYGDKFYLTDLDYF